MSMIFMGWDPYGGGVRHVPCCGPTDQVGWHSPRANAMVARDASLVGAGDIRAAIA
jgi:hypothetical protein